MIFFGIYKITNMLNGKMYIGKHKTTDLDDEYMGSSAWLKRSINKHGKENFHKEWLMFCEDEEEMNYMEYVFVDQTWVDRSDTYNLKIGGKGGWDYINSRPISEETRKKLSAITHLRNLGKKLSDITKAKIGAANRNPSIETRMKISKANKGRKMSKEQRNKLDEIIIGSKWFNNGIINIRAKKCPEGFTLGRINYKSQKGKKHLWAKDYHWFNNGTINVKAKVCPEGFKSGRLAKRNNDGTFAKS